MSQEGGVVHQSMQTSYHLALAASCPLKWWTQFNTWQRKNASQKVLLCYHRMSVFGGRNHIRSLVVDTSLIMSLKYLTWNREKAHAWVTKCRGAKFRGFHTLEEAKIYLEQLGFKDYRMDIEDGLSNQRLSPTSAYYYAVSQGRETGVFDSYR